MNRFGRFPTRVGAAAAKALEVVAGGVPLRDAILMRAVSSSACVSLLTGLARIRREDDL